MAMPVNVSNNVYKKNPGADQWMKQSMPVNVPHNLYEKKFLVLVNE